MRIASPQHFGLCAQTFRRPAPTEISASYETMGLITRMHTRWSHSQKTLSLLALFDRARPRQYRPSHPIAPLRADLAPHFAPDDPLSSRRRIDATLTSPRGTQGTQHGQLLVGRDH